MSDNWMIDMHKQAYENIDNELKDKVNRYCAEVHGNIFKRSDGQLLDISGELAKEYNPYDDLNQRAPVFDKLIKSRCPISACAKALFPADIGRWIIKHGTDKATLDFIVSTMPEKEHD